MNKSKVSITWNSNRANHYIKSQIVLGGIDLRIVDRCVISVTNVLLKVFLVIAKIINEIS